MPNTRPSLNNTILKKFKAHYFLLLIGLALPSFASVNNTIANKLPELGASPSIIPASQEYALGRAWIAAFRQQAPISTDVNTVDYLEHLVFHLAPYATRDEYQILPVVVQSSQINAFAVPGGVVGMNTGLILKTESEDQIVSVIAHELAHLSERHFARGVLAQKNSLAPSLLALVVGIAAIAAGESDAGIAAISVGQAAAIENQLKYSRQHEREADRTGIAVMADAGFDPTAAADMFKIMLDSARLNNSSEYNFFSTHPVTEARVADARNRASELTIAESTKPSTDFEYIKAAETAKEFKYPRAAIESFSQISSTFSEPARLYGLAIAYSLDQQADKAVKIIKQLLDADQERILLWVTYGQNLAKAGEVQAALTWLEQKYRFNPNNYPIAFTYAAALEQDRQYNAAQIVLERLANQRPDDPNIWYRLAEVSGLAQDIHSLHLARAEYFVLRGGYRTAERQLLFLLDDVNLSDNDRAVVEQRLKHFRRQQALAQF